PAANVSADLSVAPPPGLPARSIHVGLPPAVVHMAPPLSGVASASTVPLTTSKTDPVRLTGPVYEPPATASKFSLRLVIAASATRGTIENASATRMATRCFIDPPARNGRVCFGARYA